MLLVVVEWQEKRIRLVETVESPVEIRRRSQMVRKPKLARTLDPAMVLPVGPLGIDRWSVEGQLREMKVALPGLQMPGQLVVEQRDRLVMEKLQGLQRAKLVVLLALLRLVPALARVLLEPRQEKMVERMAQPQPEKDLTPPEPKVERKARLQVKMLGSPHKPLETMRGKLVTTVGQKEQLHC